MKYFHNFATITIFYPIHVALILQCTRSRINSGKPAVDMYGVLHIRSGFTVYTWFWLKHHYFSSVWPHFPPSICIKIGSCFLSYMIPYERDVLYQIISCLAQYIHYSVALAVLPACTAHVSLNFQQWNRSVLVKRPRRPSYRVEKVYIGVGCRSASSKLGKVYGVMEYWHNQMISILLFLTLLIAALILLEFYVQRRH